MSGTTLQENPYGALKREDEEIFAQLANGLGIQAAFPRIFNLGGPFINKTNSYALACILSDIAASGPITLRAAHPVWRGYAHVGDVLNIGLGSLLHRHNAGRFDTGGEAIEIGELASRAAQLLTGRQMTIHRPAWADGPADTYLGDVTQYNALATRLRRHAAQPRHTDYRHRQLPAHPAKLTSAPQRPGPKAPKLKLSSG